MVENKKLKDLTDRELERCGWIEKIAYRDNLKWTMYDFKTKSFKNIKDRYPDAYDEMNITTGNKWFAIYKEDVGRIVLVNIAKMDVGEGQEEARMEIEEFTNNVVSSGKVIFVVARESTSYFTFVRLAALGAIEVLKDSRDGEDLRDIVFVKAKEGHDLEKQKKIYQEKLKELEENRNNSREDRKFMLEKYIRQLRATIGEKTFNDIIKG